MSKINYESEFFSEKDILKIEEMYGAKYIYESQLRGKDGWTDIIGAIFYQENLKDPGHSHWFALYKDYMNKIYIAKADATVLVPVSAVQVGEDEYLYSHHRHHYLGRNGIDIDGGREYTRIIGRNPSESKLVQFIATPEGLVKQSDPIMEE